MEAIERRYCYYCMCSNECDSCQWCTCTVINLEFYFDKENKLHDAYKQAKIDRKVHLRKIEDLQKALEEKPEVPSVYGEMHNLWNPCVNKAQMEEHLVFLHERTYNRKSAEDGALKDMIKDGLVERVTTTVEQLKFGYCWTELDREKYCHQIKALETARQNDHEIFFFGPFAGALYKQCQQFDLVKQTADVPFKVGCNSVPIFN